MNKGDNLPKRRQAKNKRANLVVPISTNPVSGFGQKLFLRASTRKPLLSRGHEPINCVWKRLCPISSKQQCLQSIHHIIPRIKLALPTLQITYLPILTSAIWNSKGHSSKINYNWQGHVVNVKRKRFKYNLCSYQCFFYASESQTFTVVYHKELPQEPRWWPRQYKHCHQH